MSHIDYFSTFGYLIASNRREWMGELFMKNALKVSFKWSSIDSIPTLKAITFILSSLWLLITIWEIFSTQSIQVYTRAPTFNFLLSNQNCERFYGKISHSWNRLSYFSRFSPFYYFTLLSPAYIPSLISLISPYLYPKSLHQLTHMLPTSCWLRLPSLDLHFHALAHNLQNFRDYWWII